MLRRSITIIKPVPAIATSHLFFHSKKASSEQELKERAMAVKKLLAGQTGELNTRPIKA